MQEFKKHFIASLPDIVAILVFGALMLHGTLSTSIGGSLILAVLAGRLKPVSITGKPIEPSDPQKPTLPPSGLAGCFFILLLLIPIFWSQTKNDGPISQPKPIIRPRDSFHESLKCFNILQQF